MSLDYRRKAEETHTDTGRVDSCEAAALTTAPLCRPDFMLMEEKHETKSQVQKLCPNLYSSALVKSSNTGF